MDFLRVLLLLAGLFGPLLLVVGLISAAKGGSVVLPGFGLILGGFFLVIVGLVISAGGFTLFFRMRWR